MRAHSLRTSRLCLADKTPDGRKTTAFAGAILEVVGVGSGTNLDDFPHTGHVVDTITQTRLIPLLRESEGLKQHGMADFLSALSKVAQGKPDRFAGQLFHIPSYLAPPRAGGKGRVQHLLVHGKAPGGLGGTLQQEAHVAYQPEVAFRLLGDLRGQAQRKVQTCGLLGVQGDFRGLTGPNSTS